jgi:hypothetical protein
MVDDNDVIETGIIIDKTVFILECKDNNHALRRKSRFIGCNEFNDLRLINWLKGRQLESIVYLCGKRRIIDGD